MESDKQNSLSETQFGEVSSCCTLPDITVEKILKSIPESDQQRLLNCRLVCTRWNEIIKNTSELIKKIKFVVEDPREFLELKIVKAKQVRFISFIYPYYLDSEYTKSFIDLISDTVEKVEFAFVDSEMPFQDELFRLVLEKCTKLQEISTSKFPKSVGQKIFRGFPHSISIAACKTINRISIEMKLFKEEDVAGFFTFLLKLPNLKEIEVSNGYCSSEVMLQIQSGFCEYIKHYGKNNKLQLKKLLLSGDFFDSLLLEIQEFEVVLLILCGKHSIVIDASPLPSISLNTLLTYTGNGTEILPFTLLQQRPLFKAKIRGSLVFEDEDEENAKLENLDRLKFLDISILNLYIHKNLLKPEELSWIKELHKLKTLGINIQDGVELLPSSIEELKSVFSSVSHTLYKLELGDAIFSTFGRFHWSQYFPYLKALEFHSIIGIEIDLISQLTVLESLTTLTLMFTNVTDDAFTVECVNRYVNSNGSPSRAPAIACFKTLLILRLIYCNKLTNQCIVNGIAKCKALEELEINSCDNLNHPRDWVKCKVKYNGD